MKKSIKEKALKQLLWVGIVSISMFFAGLTSAFIVRKAEGNWTEFILPDWFIASTAVIILTIFNLLFTTLVLGIIFSYFQFEGWGQLTNQGIYLTGEGSNVAGSFLYVLTLSHLVHLAGGLIALVFSSVKSKLNLYSIDNCLGLDLTINYWHFLTVLWLYLFIFLKFL
jgi:cytochrome c oxidase subunit 3